MPQEQCILSYFANLNPLAEQIAQDIAEVTAAYDRIWSTLTTAERDAIVDDSIIKPEISIWYYKKSENINCSPVEHALIVKSNRKVTNNFNQNTIYAFNGKSLQTYIHQNTSLKVLHDENIGTYRDEHSFPFSFKTKSQINISGAFNNTPILGSPLDVASKVLRVGQQNASNNPAQNQNLSKPIALCSSKFVCNNVINLSAKESFGSKITLLTISTESSFHDNESRDQISENCKLLPKDVQIPKGFDFLSNW